MNGRDIVTRLLEGHTALSPDRQEAATTITSLRARVAELDVALRSIEEQNVDLRTRIANIGMVQARVAELEGLLERCRTVLGNMALENEGAIFNRWPISHEPLRNDARNLLPAIDTVLTAPDNAEACPCCGQIGPHCCNHGMEVMPNSGAETGQRPQHNAQPRPAQSPAGAVTSADQTDRALPGFPAPDQDE